MEQGIAGLLTGFPNSWVMLLCVISAVLAYFLGCINGAVVVSKYILQDDVRGHGSGNAGLTNFYRTFGGKLTLLVILADVLKMVFSVFMANVIFSTMMADIPVFVRYWAGVFCMLGHMYPCMFRFRGGKGILSGGTLVFMLDWRIALVVWGVFLIVSVATRLVSLGSCCTGVVFPIATALVYRDLSLSIIAIVVGGLILWQHRGNINRLLHGKESKFYFRRKQVKS